MLNRSPGEWARICRAQALLTSNKETRDSLLNMAADYDAKAGLSGASLNSLFYEERSGTFADAFVFHPSAETVMNGERNHELGHWRCDLSNQNKLNWSDEVYHMFGIAPGTAVDRKWVVGRYKNSSRTTLERVREYAIKRGLGFILDAEIIPESGHRRWMRIFALPVYTPGGEIIQLHGVKREL